MQCAMQPAMQPRRHDITSLHKDSIDEWRSHKYKWMLHLVQIDLQHVMELQVDPSNTWRSCKHKEKLCLFATDLQRKKHVARRNISSSLSSFNEYGTDVG